MKKSKFLQGSKDLLHRSFKPDKCKTALRLVMARLKLLRNKKELQVKQIRREVSQLLESGQDQTARIRVEHVVREEKMMAAYELIALYSELIMTRMTIIESQKNCPIDLKEAITSVIFASPRCGDVPELEDVRKQFTAKYGKDFINAAIELRPECGVSRMLVEKLSAKAPDGQAKLKILTAIAEEHSIQWDPKSFGDNDITTPNDLLNGPTTFEDSKAHYESPRYEAQSQMHEQALKPDQNGRFDQGNQNYNYTQTGSGGGGGGGTTVTSTSHHERRDSGVHTQSSVGKQSFSPEGSSSLGRKPWNMEFKDAESAAQAAAESAEQASMAARAAAEFASRDRVTKQNVIESQKSGVHVHQDNTVETHLSSESASEQFRKHSAGASSSDKRPKSSNKQVEGSVYDNLGGDDRRFDQGGYDYRKGHSRQNSSRSKASVDDDSLAHGTKYAYNDSPKSSSKEDKKLSHGTQYAYNDSPTSSSKEDKKLSHGTQYADNYSPKSSLKEDKILSGKSEYVSNLQEGSRLENFDYIQEKNTIDQSVTSSGSHSSDLYGDDYDSSDFNHQIFESHTVADPFVSSDHGRVHIAISRSSSVNDASAVSDGSGSDDDDKVLYDEGPKFDEPGPDFDFLPSGKASPFSVFSNPDAHDSEFNNSKYLSSEQNSKEKRLYGEFPEVLVAPKDDLKFDDSRPTKFDDSDGVISEGEYSSDESRRYSAKVPGKGNQIHLSSEQGNPGSDQKRSFKLNNQMTELYSDSSKNRGSPKAPVCEPPQKSGKSKLELNDKESSELKLSFPHEDEDSDRSHKSSEGLVDDETLRRTSSELTGKLNFENLTGGLRHKDYPLPPYTRSQLDDVSYSSKKPAEESSSKNLESPTVEFPSSRKAYTNVDNKTSVRAKNYRSDKYFDSSENELPEPTPSYRKPYSPAVEESKTKSKLKGSLGYFESDSEEELPKQTIAGRNNLGGGFSRRTKPTPSTSVTSKVRPTREELRNSALGAERKSMSSSSRTQSVEEPESETRSSSQSRNSDRSSSRKGSFERIPDPKTSFRQESIKSAAVEQPASPQEKVDDAIDSTKSSQASTLKGDSLSRVDSGKKASHVHPKLPDYDNFLETLRKHRT